MCVCAHEIFTFILHCDRLILRGAILWKIVFLDVSQLITKFQSQAKIILYLYLYRKFNQYK